MDIRDSTIPRVESAEPVPVGLIFAEFDEDPGYFIYHRGGAPHWVLMNTLSGAGRFTSADGLELFARPGDTTIIPPGAAHDFGVKPNQQQWRFQFAQFQPRPEWRSLLDWPQPVAGILQIHNKPAVRLKVRASLDQAIELYSGVLKNKTMFGMNALEAALLWCDSQNPHKDPIDERILRAVEIIERDLRQDLSIHALARQAALSDSRFAALFRQHLGTSPQRFVEQRRLAAAARLLDMTVRSIASVSVEVGFNDPLYFSTRFRTSMGMTPTAYRARNGARD